MADGDGQEKHSELVEWHHSDSVGELFGALANAQSEFPPLERNREVQVSTKKGGTYTFRYTSLDKLLETVRPPLSKHGLCVSQMIQPVRGSTKLVTILGHSSGQWIMSVSPILAPDAGNQAFGSGITYARRYAYNCILGVAGEEDDDANRVDGNDYNSMDAEEMRERAATHRREADRINRINSAIKGKGSDKGEGEAKSRPDAKVEIGGSSPWDRAVQLATMIEVSEEELRNYVEQRYRMKPEKLNPAQSVALVRTIEGLSDRDAFIEEMDQWRQMEGQEPGTDKLIPEDVEPEEGGDE